MMHSAPDRRLPSITTAQRGLSGNAASAVTSYISLTGITDPLIVAALNDFVVGLINDGIWSKIDVMYPFIGGTQAAHSINLKDPGTYTIVSWVGSLLHTSNGITATSLSNSSFTVPFSHASQSANDFSTGFYGRFPSGSSSTSSGLYQFNAGVTTIGLDVRSAAISAVWKMCGGTALSNGTIGVPTASTTRFVAYSSNSATTAYSFINEFTQVTTLSKGSTASGTSIGVGVSNNITDTPWTYSFWYTGKQLTETEMDKLNRRVQVLNQTLDTIQSSTRASNYYINLGYNRYTNKFISAAGIANLTSTEANAVNYLLNALDTSSTGLMSPLTDIFPFVGNTTAIQLIGGKTAVSGGISGAFSATSLGLSPDSTLSRMIPTTTFTWNSVLTVGFYITEDVTSSGYEIANDQTNKYVIAVRSASNTLIANFSNTPVSVSNTNAKGHYTARSTYNVVSAPYSIWKNGSSIASGTTTASGATTGTTYFFGQGTASLPSAMRTAGVAYYFNGLYITDAQATELNTIIQNYISLLSRT